MKTIHQILRARLKVPETDAQPVTMDDLKAQWSTRFETLMRNRLMMGGLRYGLLRNQSESWFDNCRSAIDRINRYQKTGNTECLVDAANLMLIEFEKGLHPRKHFNATDDTQHVSKL